jgi:Lar family restriction alleviation protein
MIDLQPCPFCGSLRISVYVDKQKKGIMRGEKFVYGFCHTCASRGPHVWISDSEKDDDKEKKGLEQWNKRWQDER